MSKKDILKDIEKLKRANTFLETLFADIKNYQHKEGTSYPVGVPSFSHGDEHQIKYNGMCIEILEYFVGKLGDKEVLNLGKYFTCWFDMCETRIRIGFGLNNEVTSKLYDDVFGSWSTIYLWSEKHILPLLSLLTRRYLDFETVFSFFKYIGSEGYSNERRLAWDTSVYTKSVTEAKKIIDNIFKLSEDKEVLKDMDEVLDVYFDKVFKNNKEEDLY